MRFSILAALALTTFLSTFLFAGCSPGLRQEVKNITRIHITRSNGSTPLRRRYDQLTHGMTADQVVALMGPPQRERKTTKDGFTFTVYTYAEGDWRAIVVVSPAHGLVVAHSSDDPDFAK